MFQAVNIATRRNYSAHLLRAHLQGFAPLSLAQFVRFEFFRIHGFSL